MTPPRLSDRIKGFLFGYPSRADLGWTCLALVLMTAAVGVVCGVEVRP
jgi:hypothetical protein